MNRDDRRKWVRWFDHVGLPSDHVAAILETDLATVESDLAIQRRLRLPPPTLPPFGSASPHRHNPAVRPILAQTGDKVRHLGSLGYDSARIGEVLMLDPGRVADFLARVKPVRRERLARPRDRNEHRRAVANAARREARKAELAARAAWGNPHDVPVVVVPSSRPVDDLAVGPDVAGSSARAVDPPPAPNPWTGSAAFYERGPKLSEAAIREAAELLCSGLSYPAVARRLGVSVSTLRTYLAAAVGPRRRPAGEAPRKPDPLPRVRCKPAPAVDRRRKLSPAQREEIRALHSAGDSLRNLAAKFGVTKLCIFNVIHCLSSEPSPPVSPPLPAPRGSIK